MERRGSVFSCYCAPTSGGWTAEWPGRSGSGAVAFLSVCHVSLRRHLPQRCERICALVWLVYVKPIHVRQRSATSFGGRSDALHRHKWTTRPELNRVACMYLCLVCHASLLCACFGPEHECARGAAARIRRSAPHECHDRHRRLLRLRRERP